MVVERMVGRVAWAVALTVLAAVPAAAQTATRKMAEVGVGWATFVDEDPVDHATVSGGARWFVTPRLAVGPQITFMNGPGQDHDLELTGVATFDLRRQSTRVVPYLVVAGGFTSTTLPVGTGLYTSQEGALSGGVGVRIGLGTRLYVAPEFRIGWEPIARFGVAAGYAW